MFPNGLLLATAAAFASSLLGLAARASPLIQSQALAARQTVDAPQNTSSVLKRNCAYWGWYPDDGNKLYGSQGTLQTLAELNAAVGVPAFAVGAYAHIDNDYYDPDDPSTYFNGSEILPFIEQALAANATFVASISPVHGYGGFQSNDTNNAVAIVKVLKDFVDAGVEVWLRWGHEMNWYTEYGSDDGDPNHKRQYYAGGASDFLAAWKVTYNVVNAALPTVKFMWCVNVGEMSDLWQFWPGQNYVDIVGLDYYTLIGVSEDTYTYVDTLIQQTHDTFALAYDKPFWLGETGTRSNKTSDNLQWINTITSESACQSMPNYEGAFWFNYQKNDLDHRVVHVDGSAPTNAFVELMTGGPAPNPTSLASSLYAGFEKISGQVQAA